VNVLLVYAHPEPRSLNGSIRDFMVDRLIRAGHGVEVSDLRHALEDQSRRR
jgi:NAD(P)H dehydrogenase (quinone)